MPAAASQINKVTLSKGELTRQAILDTSLKMAAELGLEGLTIGTVATEMGLSKSGVFAHFGSRDDLILAVIDYGSRQAAEQMMVAAVSVPRGLPRLQVLFEGWVRRYENAQRGCIFMAGASEYDDRPGPIRDAIQQVLLQMRGGLHKCVKMAHDEDHLPTGSDVEMISFQLFSAVVAAHLEYRLFGDRHVFRKVRELFALLTTGSKEISAADNVSQIEANAKSIRHNASF
jgi:AcrR family transcriptional regulator